MTDPINHVVLLILENHSFDQMLGCFKSVHAPLEGVDPLSPGKNVDSKGDVFEQRPTSVRNTDLDPHHEMEHVQQQLAKGNSGFVSNFESCYPESTAAQRNYIMDYYPLGDLPGLHSLGRDFMICDRWHASVPGPTWPNRFFALTGTSSGQVDMPDDGAHQGDLKGYLEQQQATIFDRLNEKHVPWKVYFSGLPQSVVLGHQREPENMARYFRMEQFFADAAGPEAEFPAVSVIEPDFMGAGQNDDHPPHDVMKAQKLIAAVYNAIRANGALWDSTLLVVFYDEHGGFYDHVPPPQAPPPDEHTGYPFDLFGVRVPAILVSPWVSRGFTSTLFDHTSVLRYLIDKWGLGSLGKRAAAANNIGTLITVQGQPRTDTAPRIDFPSGLLSSPLSEVLAASDSQSSHHVALKMLASYLEQEALDSGAGGLFLALHRLSQLVREFLASLGLIDPAAVVKAKFELYHGLQREQAKPKLAAIVRDQSASPEKRRQAARCLGHLVDVNFDRAVDPVLAATAWLEKSGF